MDQKRLKAAKKSREYTVKKISKKSKEEIYTLLNWQNDMTFNRINQLDLGPNTKAELIKIIKDHEYTDRVIVDALFRKSEKEK
jgi:hypothetical protein